MKFEDLQCGTIETCAPEDTYIPDHYEEAGVDVDALIESGRREYHEAWWDYVGEFN